MRIAAAARATRNIHHKSAAFKPIPVQAKHDEWAVSWTKLSKLQLVFESYPSYLFVRLFVCIWPHEIGDSRARDWY